MIYIYNIRYHLFGRWPYDESLTFSDYTYEYDSHNYEKELLQGPPKLITRSCTNGTGNSSDPFYVYTPIPQYFECTSNSKYCYNDSTVKKHTHTVYIVYIFLMFFFSLHNFKSYACSSLLCMTFHLFC